MKYPPGFNPKYFRSLLEDFCFQFTNINIILVPQCLPTVVSEVK